MTVPDSAADLLLELERRKKRFRVENYCFPEQVAAIRDPSHFKTECCSRRAGKTVGGAADLVETALDFPATVSLYLTLSRLNAKRIIWSELLQINRKFELGAQVNETELCLTFPNASRIFLSGAKDKTEIEKFRGLALKKVRIDEAQAFKSYLQELVDEVLAKALYDHDGTLVLSGTPGAVPAGYFYDCTQSPDWAHFGWTMLQNPHLKAKSGKDPMDLILADCRRMGVGLEDPRIQRECFGKWMVDPESLVFRYTEQNHYDELPAARHWQYVIGVDLGYNDADAIAVLGWCEKGPEAFLIEEQINTKQGVTELATALGKLIARYEPLAVVMDTGGLGKKIAEEIRRRYGLPIAPAQKTEKFTHIELVNDAFRTRRFFAKKTSRFAQDCQLVEWDWDKSSGDRLVVSDSYHSDACDAVLYAYRAALGWLHVPEKVKPKTGTKEWHQEQEAKIWADTEARLTRGTDDPASWPEPDDFGEWSS